MIFLGRTKKKKIIKIDGKGKKRLQGVLIAIFLVLLALIIRICYLQFIKGNNLKEMAVRNQLSSKTIEANRGTIYDSTGKVLAKSTDVDSVYINPSKLKYSDGTDVNKEARFFAFCNGCFRSTSVYRC